MIPSELITGGVGGRCCAREPTPIHDPEPKGDLKLAYPANSPSPCHPRCVWHCTDPVCDQTCWPVCKAPNCQVRCPQITTDYCAESCDEPDCAVICPKKANCTMHTCQECSTVCKKASCQITCSAPPCQSICED